MHTRVTLIAAVSVLLVGAFAVALVTAPHPTPLRALDSLSKCFTPQAPEDIADVPCLERTVSRLMERYTATDIMRNIYTTSTPPVVARNCHTIGHLVGHKTYTQSASLEKAFEQCTISCRHACIHGATAEAVEQEIGETYSDVGMEHSDVADLMEVGRRYCDKGRLFCHAIGHFLRISLPSHTEALSACDSMGTNAVMCQSGVFMEDASSIESDISGDEGVTRAVYDDYVSPCDDVASRYQTQCFRYLPMYQSNLFAERGITSASEQIRISTETCESLAPTERTRCFFGFGSYAYRLRDDNGEPLDLRDVCEALGTDADKEACTVAVVRSFLTGVPPQYYKALHICADIPDAGRKERCYHATFQLTVSTGSSVPEPACGMNPPAGCESASESYGAIRNNLPDFYFGPAE